MAALHHDVNGTHETDGVPGLGFRLSGRSLEEASTEAILTLLQSVTVCSLSQWRCLFVHSREDDYSRSLYPAADIFMCVVPDTHLFLLGPALPTEGLPPPPFVPE